MRVLEWAVMFPDRVRGIAPLAVSATATADQIAIQSIQLHAIRADPRFRGVGLPARLGRGSVRSRTPHRARARPAPGALELPQREEFHLRFGRAAQRGEEPFSGGRFAVESYLDHHGAKLVDRFDAASYVVLTDAMNTHDVGRGRGGIHPALARYRGAGEVAVAGVDSDRLYPIEEQHALAHLLGVPGERAHVVRSPHGHDAFLIESRQVGTLLSDLLERVTAS
jgi:homoserine O-acetyltransferase/O-succinyltransferase